MAYQITPYFIGLLFSTTVHWTICQQSTASTVDQRGQSAPSVSTIGPREMTAPQILHTPFCYFYSLDDCLHKKQCDRKVKPCIMQSSGTADSEKITVCGAFWKRSNGTITMLRQDCFMVYHDLDAEEHQPRSRVFYPQCHYNVHDGGNRQSCYCTNPLCNDGPVGPAPNSHQLRQQMQQALERYSQKYGENLESNRTIMSLVDEASHSCEGSYDNADCRRFDRYYWVVYLPIFSSLLFYICVTSYFYWAEQSMLFRLKEIHRNQQLDTLNNSLMKKGKLLSRGTSHHVHAYGNVGEMSVVVKSVPSTKRQLWSQEVKFYRTLSRFSHENILKFVGATKTVGKDPEYWLVLEYHTHRSIADYLATHVISWLHVLHISVTATQGLAFLHEEITGPLLKSSIVHRDIKPSNILLRSDLTAVIADFDLAYQFTDDRFRGIKQVGTHRYMAPEMIDGAIEFDRKSLMSVDVYALSLVFWELLARSELAGDASEEYKLAYSDLVISHYNIVECMRIEVAKKGCRPQIPKSIEKDPNVMEFVELMEECWDQDSESRLNALLIIKRLHALIIQ